ncbi:MAG: hypothetical protein AAGA55_12725, partial [Planctomycetota bacterium]
MFLTPFVLLILLIMMLVASTVNGRSKGSYKKIAAALNPGEAACGSCRYPIRPAETETCPECGQRIIHAGLISPALVLRWRPG